MAGAFERWLEVSPSLEAPLRGIEKAAASDAPLLILGESGTGRSSLVRALHACSLRRDRPLVDVDPSVIPYSLFDSDLFGHRRGAFTGATSDAPGRIERANGGAIVLDHLEDLPLAIQPKLLRLLAEKVYTPLGGREKTADLRFFAIGSPDLPQRATRGLFRPDLFFRLEVLRFELPPLRERMGDLPGLCRALLADLAGRLERPIPRVSERSWAWMTRYAWPGNLRQLRNLLERSLILTDDGDELDLAPPRDLAIEPPRTLADVEEIEIRKALAYARGNQSEAAALLGISRKSLWERRRRLGIP